MSEKTDSIIVDQQNELQLLLSDCIQIWSLVEMELSQLFSLQLRTKPPRIAYIIWDSVISFEAKLKCLDAVLSFSLKNEKKNEILNIWKKLGEKVRQYARLRNELAHSGHLIEGERVYIVPYLSMEKLMDEKTKKLDAKDLEERKKNF